MLSRPPFSRIVPLYQLPPAASLPTSTETCSSSSHFKKTSLEPPHYCYSPILLHVFPVKLTERGVHLCWLTASTSSPLAPTICCQDSNETASKSLMTSLPNSKNSVLIFRDSVEHVLWLFLFLVLFITLIYLIWGEEHKLWSQGGLDPIMTPLALLSPLMCHQHHHLHMPQTPSSSQNLSLLRYIWSQRNGTTVYSVASTRILDFILMLPSPSLATSRVCESFSALHPYCWCFTFHPGYWKTFNRPCCCHSYLSWCGLHTTAERSP